MKQVDLGGGSASFIPYDIILIAEQCGVEKKVQRERFIVEWVVLAKLFMGIRPVLGQLHMKDDKLSFESYAIVTHPGKVEIPYNEIKSVIPHKIAFIFPTGISVIVKNGQKFEFILQHVRRRNEVVETISARIHTNQ